jgi:2-polyprenyl-6-methoxyphenol hydroxylase-like FAD-dependent oxidoreductase
MKERKTEVLVAGAGPAGLLTAILLAENGVEVQIIDREERTASRSYACALHPRTLRLLHRLGLVEELLARGRRVESIAFYDGAERCAEVKMESVGGEFPFLLVLPQSALEELLEERLFQKSKTKVLWNHRLDGFENDDQAVVATVEKLGGTATGYIVPHWQTIVQKRFPIRAQFLLGADGHNSLVRERLGIEYESVGETQSFVACEFTSGSEVDDELRVVLDETTTNVLWPLPGNACRWTFQLIHSNGPNDFPEKERRAMRAAEKVSNDNIRHNVERLAHSRAPWFSSQVDEILWCKQVFFERRLARQFGKGRCWLIGDAAHQTGPVGVQSMNGGLAEAEQLTTILHRILRERKSLKGLEKYDRQRREEWRELLGLSDGFKLDQQATPWIKRRASRILSCLPASGEDLKRLVNDLGQTPAYV